jgi:hypothetical protein
MRGLLKYLQQTLQITVERPDSFKKLTLSSDTPAAKFHENVSDFGIVYGLALQCLGIGKIESNLLPRSISRSMAWANKTKYFVSAACLLFLVSLMSLGRTYLDKMNYEKQETTRQSINNIISQARTASSKLSTEQGKSSGSKTKIEKARKPFQNRDILPLLNQTILTALPNNNKTNDQKQAELYKSFKEGDLSKIKQIPRKERKLIFITNMQASFTDDIASASFLSMEMQAGGKTRKARKSLKKKKPTLTDLIQKQFGGGKKGSKFGLKTTTKKKGGGTKGQTDEAISPGFVVTIAGYTSYEDPIELLDPYGVENNSNQWGFITRLMHLDENSVEKSPFKLYQKGNKDHFALKISPVDLTKQMPPGIGIMETREIITRNGQKYSENVLIDPMTKEVISTRSSIDSDGRELLDQANKPIIEENDHWFTIDLKFVWEQNPTTPDESDSKTASAPGKNS